MYCFGCLCAMGIWDVKLIQVCSKVGVVSDPVIIIIIIIYNIYLTLIKINAYKNTQFLKIFWRLTNNLLVVILQAKRSAIYYICSALCNHRIDNCYKAPNIPLSFNRHCQSIFFIPKGIIYIRNTSFCLLLNELFIEHLHHLNV